MITTDALPQAQPECDDALAGRYRLGDPLDPTGRGQVLLARDLRLGRDVAVKILGPADTTNKDSLGSAGGLAQLAHPNVAGVYDVVESNGLRYLMMELVPGETLDAAVRARGPLEPLEAIRIAVQLAEGLSAVHRFGFVHCDVKPGNVVLTPAGSAKLVDFGTARPAGRDEDERVVGSAPYVAPERLTSNQLDGRSDVYSLGATLYEMLTGRSPHMGLDDEETIQRAMREDAVSPNLLNPKVPEDLAAVAAKALSRDPELRFPTALAMASALRTVGVRLRAASTAATSDFARREHTINLPHLVMPRRGSPRRRPLAFGAIVAGLLLFGAWGMAGGAPLAPALAGATARATAAPSATSAATAELLSTIGSLATPILTATATPVPTLDVPALADPTATAPPSPTATPSPTPDPTRAPVAPSQQVSTQVVAVAPSSGASSVGSSATRSAAGGGSSSVKSSGGDSPSPKVDVKPTPKPDHGKSGSKNSGKDHKKH